ncbi:hypothetical protein [Streptomyces roseoverticillatus]|uniref:Uncharacterized protein n=1 Tax=Streptomyces roseoverticillatus TaxID=66429 RepID=A0ABV3J537_9ACTN
MDCSVHIAVGAGVLVLCDDGKRRVQCPVCREIEFRCRRWDLNDQFGSDPWIPDAVPPGCTATINVRVLAMDRSCWKCGETTTCVVGLYPTQPARTDQWPRMVDEESLAWVKGILAGAGFGGVAESIKPRWSSTVGARYLSNGCQLCDALQGDFPLQEEASELFQEGGVEAFHTLVVAEVSSLVWQQVVHGERGQGGNLLM